MSAHAVLFVDDEAQILTSLRRLVRKEPYTLFTAGSGAEGLAILAEHEVHVIVSDQRMPQMSGTEFLAKSREIAPDAVRIMLSGYAEPEAILSSINQGEVFRFIAKPWGDEELKTNIRQCLAHYDIVMDNRKLTEQSARQLVELENLNHLLQASVDERTRSLQFSQEVLENLPLSVVGVSQEEEIILTNQAARACFDDLRQLIPGTEMSEVLPAEAVAAIRASLTSADCGDFDFAWGEHDCVARPHKLGEPTAPRGLVLLLEEK